MDNQALYLTVMAVAIAIGIAATVIYYFARYYIKTGTSEDSSGEASKGFSQPATSLREALQATRSGFWGRLGAQESNLPIGVDKIEEALFTSDLGPRAAGQLFNVVSQKLQGGDLTEQKIREVLKSEMLTLFEKVRVGRDLFVSTKASGSEPKVWMVVGVNGVGKTTTIGKLAQKGKMQGLKVMVVAGDTYRAAADAQISVWAKRAGVELFNPDGVKDPAAVAFAGLEKAKSQKFGLVIVDTAGRLHTQTPLMEELKKLKRVMAKVIPTAPHETLLVVDANSGQNAQVQARQFHEALGLSGVIVTKLDGTAKGGVVLGIVDELKLDIPLIGVGEGVDDLRDFSAQEFVDSIL